MMGHDGKGDAVLAFSGGSGSGSFWCTMVFRQGKLIERYVSAFAQNYKSTATSSTSTELMP
jgi:hypothetical protein